MCVHIYIFLENDNKHTSSFSYKVSVCLLPCILLMSDTYDGWIVVNVVGFCKEEKDQDNIWAHFKNL